MQYSRKIGKVQIYTILFKYLIISKLNKFLLSFKCK